MGLIAKIMYKIEKKDKSFVSEADQRLAAFDKQHPKRSASQRSEILKHRNIFQRALDLRVPW